MEKHKEILERSVVNYLAYGEKDLKSRGLKKVLCFVSDGFNGLQEVMNDVYPKADTQRCIVHKTRNILSLVRHQDKQEITSDFKKVYGNFSITCFTVQNSMSNIQENISSVP